MLPLRGVEDKFEEREDKNGAAGLRIGLVVWSLHKAKKGPVRSRVKHLVGRGTIALDRPKRSGDTPHRVADEMPCLVKGGAP